MKAQLYFGDFGNFGATPEETGLKALKYFYEHNWGVLSLNKPTFEEFIAAIKATKSGKFAVEAIGNGIELTEMTDGKVNNAMKALAAQTKGSMPVDYQVFVKALQTELQAINATFIKDVVLASVDDIKKMAVQGAEFAVSAIKWGMPIVAASAIMILYLVYKIKFASGAKHV